MCCQCIRFDFSEYRDLRGIYVRSNCATASVELSFKKHDINIIRAIGDLFHLSVVIILKCEIFFDEQVNCHNPLLRHLKYMYCNSVSYWQPLYSDNNQHRYFEIDPSLYQCCTCMWIWYISAFMPRTEQNRTRQSILTFMLYIFRGKESISWMFFIFGIQL